MPQEADRVTFTQEEQERCRESFLKFDLDRSGASEFFWRVCVFSPGSFESAFFYYWP
jgi:hypothetical protein